MTTFDKNKVITGANAEKAEIGKNYWFSDHIGSLKKIVEENSDNFFHTLEHVKDIEYGASPFVDNNGTKWEYIYPYEEPPKQRMTNLQLMEWLAKGKGLSRYLTSNACFTYFVFCESDLGHEASQNIKIRSWDADEWIEPTVDIYERDCKGGKECKN